MEILNWNKLIVIPLLLIFYGCGQQTMKDEGLETKDISEAVTTPSSTDSADGPPTVSSVEPENNDNNVSTSTSIQITFNESILVSGAIMTNGSSCGGGVSYDISTSSSFSTCLPWEGSPTYSNSYKRLSIKPKNDLLSNTTYYVRVRSDGSSQIKDYSSEAMTETKTWSFTTN